MAIINRFWFAFQVVLLFLSLAAKFATEQIQPMVKEMDEKSHMPQTLIDKLFENGVRRLKL